MPPPSSGSVPVVLGPENPVEKRTDLVLVGGGQHLLVETTVELKFVFLTKKVVLLGHVEAPPGVTHLALAGCQHLPGQPADATL